MRKIHPSSYLWLIFSNNWTYKNSIYDALLNDCWRKRQSPRWSAKESDRLQAYPYNLNSSHQGGRVFFEKKQSLESETEMLKRELQLMNIWIGYSRNHLRERDPWGHAHHSLVNILAAGSPVQYTLVAVSGGVAPR